MGASRSVVIADAYERLAEHRHVLDPDAYGARMALLHEARREPAAPYLALIAEALRGLS